MLTGTLRVKLKIESVIKANESLAQIILKNKIKQLFLQYKHRNNIHEHEKQQNK